MAIIANFSLTSRGKAAFSRSFGGGLVAFFWPAAKSAARGSSLDPPHDGARRKISGSASVPAYVYIYID